MTGRDLPPGQILAAEGQKASRVIFTRKAVLLQQVTHGIEASK
jgi:hypothetical protein